jgi:hypothetical protein
LRARGAALVPQGVVSLGEIDEAVRHEDWCGALRISHLDTPAQSARNSRNRLIRRLRCGNERVKAPE